MDGSDTAPEHGRPKRQLSLFDSICIIVGIIIGAGIYETSPVIAGCASSPLVLIGLWVVGGLVALIGALCYAELTTAYPVDGGDYVYLSRAYGRRVGFLFAWSEYWIIRPGNVGMMAFVFARFANDIYPLQVSSDKPHLDFVVYALAALLVLTGLNLLGVRVGKGTQNLLTAIKVAGLLALVVIGLCITPAHVEKAASTTTSPETSSSLRLALIFILFTYGGWNEMSYVAAEVKNPQRNLLRALVLGTVVITLLYVGLNLAFLRTLGLEGTSQSQAVAADALRQAFSDDAVEWKARAGRLVSILVCLSCLGAINGMLFTGSRVFFAAGLDHRIISWLGRWSARWDAPIRALLLQLAITVALVAGFGQYDQGFNRLLNFTTPVYWLFATLLGIALFRLRRLDPFLERPYKVLFYPITPILFCISCGFLFYSSFTYALSQDSLEAIWTLALFLVGIGVSFLSRRPPAEAGS